MSHQIPSQKAASMMKADSALKFSNIEALALVALCESGLALALKKLGGEPNAILNIVQVFSKLSAEADRTLGMIKECDKEPFRPKPQAAADCDLSSEEAK